MDKQMEDYSDKKQKNKKVHPNNYRPIICLPLQWKILTAQIREEILYSVICHGLNPEEQKGCYKGSGDLRYIYEHTFKESITRWKM